MAGDTKERILEAAFDMFAAKGYDGTNTRELATSLGLAKSSLYRHFESKEDIRDAVFEMITREYERNFGAAGHAVQIPESLAQLKQMTMGMVNYTIHDERIIKSRKVLFTEQFKDDKVKALATRHFNIGIAARFEKVFSGMMKKGLLKKDNPEMMALMYSSSISNFIYLSDREPDKMEESIRKIEEFVDYFISTFGSEGKR